MRQVVLLLITVFCGMAQENRIPKQIDLEVPAALVNSTHPKAQAGTDQGALDPAQKIGYVTLLLRPSAVEISSD